MDSPGHVVRLFGRAQQDLSFSDNPDRTKTSTSIDWKQKSCPQEIGRDKRRSTHAFRKAEESVLAANDKEHVHTSRSRSPTHNDPGRHWDEADKLVPTKILHVAVRMGQQTQVSAEKEVGRS